MAAWVMEDWALITGASSGIGRELAKVLATNKFNVILVARNEQRLKQLAEEIVAYHKVSVKVLAQDLGQPGAASDIFHALRETTISVLVNNAGFGNYGSFAKADLAIETDMMQVNMVALVQLTHWFVQPMLARDRGRILNVASTAAFQPGPMVNVYYATKAFVYSFTYALADELSGTGVSATALCPGMTHSEFQERAHMSHGSSWPMMSAAEVASAGYRGLMKGKRVVVPGVLNQIGTFFAKRVPPRLTSAVVRRIHRP